MTDISSLLFLSWAIINCFVSTTPTMTTCVTAKGLDSFAGLASNLKKAYPLWSPRAILDIGANEGKWSTNVRKVYPESKILMLEASDQHVKSLKNVVQSIGNAKYRIEVCSERDGDVIPFYFNPKASTGNSMFREETTYFANVKPVNKISSKLDTILKEEANEFLRGNDNQAAFDYIKIDVQGAELMVLRGGLKTLGGATFVQFEGSTVEYNLGGSCFYEIDEFLRSNGFYYYDHDDDLRHPGLFKTYGLGQWDILYVNPDSEHLPIELKKKGPHFCGRTEKKTDHATAMNLVDSGYDFSDFTSEEKQLGFGFGLMLGIFLGVYAPAVCKMFVKKIKERKSRRLKQQQ